MRLTRIADPVSQPITAFEALRHCRVDHNEDDQYIETLIQAVTDHLDGPSGILGRAIMSQTWLLELEGWSSRIELPIEPIQSVSLSWLDAEGVETVLEPSRYTLVSNPSAKPFLTIDDRDQLPEVVMEGFPVRITIVAGWPFASEVPSSLKIAMLMMVEHLYERGSVDSVGFPPAVSAMLARWRVML